MSSNDIYYCHVRKRTKSLDPGHWFFNTGSWVLCASAGYVRRNRRWAVDVSYERPGKPLAQTKLEFMSVDECKKFVSEYFSERVVDVSVRDMPKPESL